eukprot:4299989-Amphidinium_carterae.2
MSLIKCIKAVESQRTQTCVNVTDSLSSLARAPVSVNSRGIVLRVGTGCGHLLNGDGWGQQLDALPFHAKNGHTCR